MTNKKKSAWHEDSLERQKEADYLRTYLNKIYQDNAANKESNSFVLNLNAPWGYGKSYFLENLKFDLEATPHPVIYFDAWKNDYSKNPILGFISEIGEALKIYKKEIPKGEELTKNFYTQGKKIIGTVTGLGINILARKLTGLGVDSIKEQLNISDKAEDIESIAGEKAEAFAGEIVQKSLDDHQELKGLIEEFKITLEKITNSLHENANYVLPMYILIDELDRCRPTYAIELLENIKHIFNADGIFFVIATNKDELAHSIKAVYGNSFDSYNYLRRFFNQEYTISLSSRKKFTSHLFNKHRISTVNLFIPFEAQLNNTTKIEELLFEKTAEGFDLSLRDMEQICVQLRSILLTAQNNKIHYFYLLFILILRFKNIDISKLNQNTFKNFQVVCLLPVREDRFSSRPQDVSAEEIYNFYHSIASRLKKDVIQMYNHHIKPFEELVLNELSNEKISSNQSTSLSSYELLAKQAGHIS